MKPTLYFLAFCLVACVSNAGSLNVIVPKSYAKIMKSAIVVQDAPAACWLLGMAQGYLKALNDSGNARAANPFADIKDHEGKCGGKNSSDLTKTFTPEEWARITLLQKKIETTEF